MTAAILAAVLGVVLLIVLSCISDMLDSHRHGPVIGFSMLFCILGCFVASGLLLYLNWGVW